MKSTEKLMWDGQGNPYFGDYDPENGHPDSAYITNLYHVSCGMSSLTTELSVETREIRESCSGQRGVLATRPGARTLTASLTLYQYDPRTLAIALFGVAKDHDPGSVTAEKIPMPAKSGVAHLRYLHVSNVLLSDANGIDYVLGTHFAIEDAKAGRLRIIEHPAGAQGPLSAVYQYGEQVSVAAFTTQAKERGIVFDGINSDGLAARVTIPRLMMTANGALNWVSEEESEITLSGPALVVPKLSEDENYGQFMRVAMAKAA